MYHIKSLLMIMTILMSSTSVSDVIKPVLSELSIHENNKIVLVIDLSVEAAMTNIGSQFKDTTKSPNSDEYDRLRSLQPDILLSEFTKYRKVFDESLILIMNREKIVLTPSKTKIDIVGYKKRPRKSVLTYTATTKHPPSTIEWKYDKTYGDTAFRWQVYKENEYNWNQWNWIKAGESIVIDDTGFSPIQTTTDRAKQFIEIGFAHVIPMGLDHILFIVGMALSTLLWRRLIKLVTIFTVAHTITIALAMLDIVNIPPSIVEPLIALSIAYIAIENLVLSSNHRREEVVVLIFGLIHGMGFASMLREFKMTTENFLPTLVGFNVGVELAQLLIVSTVLIITISANSISKKLSKVVIIVPSILIAVTGLYMTVTRII